MAKNTGLLAYSRPIAALRPPRQAGPQTSDHNHRCKEPPYMTMVLRAVHPTTPATLHAGALLDDATIRVRFEYANPLTHPTILHWGLVRRPGQVWRAPPQTAWPAGTAPAGSQAVQTPFQPDGSIDILLPAGTDMRYIGFVLHLPHANTWDNNNGKDYFLELPQPSSARALLPQHPPASLSTAAPCAQRPLHPSPALQQAANTARDQLGPDATLRWIPLDNAAPLACIVLLAPPPQPPRCSEPSEPSKPTEPEQPPVPATIRLLCQTPAPILMHWGLADRYPGGPWKPVPASLQPPHTTAFDALAVRTPFHADPACPSIQQLCLTLPPATPAIAAVLFEPASARWIKSAGRDLHIPLAHATDRGLSTDAARIEQRIIEREAGNHGWTLMHRFHLCTELLAEHHTRTAALWRIYTLLRLSQIRQLTWQRNFNTKPRELAHAQDRLSQTLAAAWPAASTHRQRSLIAMALASFGPGGDGQRVRDDILNIMHRNHVREQAGEWLEQWHQKLHNNTTPDDIAICEAYIAFLEHDGDLATYHRVLALHGVTPQRLAQLDRPITANPRHYPDRKQALLNDLRDYLRLLRSVHASADLATAAATVRLDAPLAEDLARLVQVGPLPEQPDQQTAELLHRAERYARLIAHVRQRLQQPDHHPPLLRDLLYLRHALTTGLRQLIEAASLRHSSEDDLLSLLHAAVTALQAEDAGVVLREPVRSAVRALADLRPFPTQDPPRTDAARRAYAAADLLGRSVLDHAARTARTLNRIARRIGRPAGAQPWALKLFGEEVVRGTAAAAVSRLLAELLPRLFRMQGGGDWQLIAPGPADGAVGRLTPVPTLRSTAQTHFADPVILAAHELSGEDDVPSNVTAVLTQRPVDLLSHLAVRARNTRTLLAACYNPDAWAALQPHHQSTVRVRINAAQLHILPEQAPPTSATATPPSAPVRPQSIPACLPEAAILTLRQARTGLAGSKTLNLRRLAAARLAPARIPRSRTLSFAMMHQAIQHAQRLNAYHHALQHIGPRADPASLAHHAQTLRQLIQTLPPEGPVAQAVLSMAANQLRLDPARQSLAWKTVCHVWASLFTDRAIAARNRAGIDHQPCAMAVLVQRIVPAMAGFVAHTTHPLTRSPDQLLLELVPGLGETLVSGEPGPALALILHQPHLRPEIISYPGKAIALQADPDAFIFRSDSNAEDLPGFAGAGLHESIALPPAKPRRPRLWGKDGWIDWATDTGRLQTIARICHQVASRLGGPQDIEGAITPSGRIVLLQARPQVGLDDTPPHPTP